MSRTLRYTLVALTCLAAAACGRVPWSDRTPHRAASQPVSRPTKPTTASMDGPLYTDTASSAVVAPAASTPVQADPVVIPGCHLTIMEKQDVPSRRDGVLLYVGTPLGAGESVPPEQIDTVRIGTREIKVRRLREDDVVQAGQVIAQLDDSVQRDDLAIKIGRVKAAEADLRATEKTRDEMKWRYEQETKAASSGVPGVTSLQDLRGTKLAYERLIDEAVSKLEAVHLAELERDQAQTVVEMYQIRSSITGRVKTIHRKPGEAVKSFDPVVTIQNLGRLRAEGFVDGQYLNRLHKGMSVVIEPAVRHGPEQTLIGHLQDVTAVAVTSDANPRIVSASEDGTVRVWDRATRREQRVLRHPAAVRAIACTSPGAVQNWCLSGAADGVGRLWDLNGSGTRPVRELTGGHHGAITSVAFSPDGKQCATGGDDCQICLWDSATGKALYHLPVAHRGPITSLAFTPRTGLVSAGLDNTLRVWTLGRTGGKLETTFDHRTGDIKVFGLSRDGRRIAFDQGKTLRLLSLSDGLTDGVLQGPTGSANFMSFALLSPDGRLLLTAGASEGQLRLWRTPDRSVRGHPLCEFVTGEHAPASCAAFAPTGSFAVTASQDRVYVWPVPSADALDRPLPAEITLIEQAVESAAGQVRVWAEFTNPRGALLPGTNVTIVAYPER